MSLQSVNRPGIATANGVHFPMRDNQQRSVRIHVTLEALWGEQAPGKGVDPLARFEAGRRLFEYMAAQKYDFTRPVPKITITADDVSLMAERVARRLGPGSGRDAHASP